MDFFTFSLDILVQLCIITGLTAVVASVGSYFWHIVKWKYTKECRLPNATNITWDNSSVSGNSTDELENTIEITRN